MISAYIDKELTETERIDFEEHISGCESCKNELSILQSIVNSCSQIEELELPDNFNEELHKKLMQTKQDQKHNSPPWYLNWRMYSGIAAGLIVIVVLKTQVFDYMMKSEKAYVSDTQLNTAADMKPFNQENVQDQTKAEDTLGEKNVLNDSSNFSVMPRAEETENKIPTRKQTSENSKKQKTEEKIQYHPYSEAGADRDNEANTVIVEERNITEEMNSKELNNHLVMYSKEVESTESKSVDEPSEKRFMLKKSSDSLISGTEEYSGTQEESETDAAAPKAAISVARSLMSEERPELVHVSTIIISENDMEHLLNKLKESVPDYDKKAEDVNNQIQLKLDKEEYLKTMDMISALQLDMQIDADILDKGNEYDELTIRKNTIQEQIDILRQKEESLQNENEIQNIISEIEKLESELAAIDKKLSGLIEESKSNIIIIKKRTQLSQ